MEEMIPYLSADRREKVFSYRSAADRVLSAAAYLLLRLSLKTGWGVDEPIAFVYGETGKPSLGEYPHIHFSLSHCRGAVACAVSDAPVGVDVQDIETAAVEDGAARMALTAEEYAAYKTSAFPDEFFCKIWVVKESFLKKNGQGVGIDLTLSPAESFGARTLLRIRDYYCCATGEFRPRRIGAEEFRAAVGKLKKGI
ncbi:MAG: 4'-phosphopantetheinyl transferase superfamily protein [Chitinispirillales bacterium]|jgi:4'-phosphopantetheinyl transferase|nr:4'-phosphopantetheinyl transferase superfamily protein [Chitinispirillales bacterium]